MNRHHMERAIQLAKRSGGAAAPNPNVGAVVVNKGKVVGEGWHKGPGSDHAEVMALKQAGDAASGATIYVTLEPCNHFGHTPPCTDAILKYGIRKVVIGVLDPNPRVEGGGAARLERSGLIVQVGLCEAACAQLIEPFVHHIHTGRPLVTGKYAMTMDGKIASASGDSKWISSEASRAFVHEIRHQCGAVLIGSGTALQDNPRLTARGGGKHQPWRVVLDGRGRIFPDAKLFHEAGGQVVMITTSRASNVAKNAWADAGALVWTIEDENQKVDLLGVLHKLGEQGIQHVLCEGGAGVFGALAKASLLDRWLVFVAPKVLGNAQALSPVSGIDSLTMKDAYPLRFDKVDMLGDDIVLSGKRRDAPCSQD